MYLPQIVTLAALGFGLFWKALQYSFFILQIRFEQPDEIYDQIESFVLKHANVLSLKGYTKKQWEQDGLGVEHQERFKLIYTLSGSSILWYHQTLF